MVAIQCPIGMDSEAVIAKHRELYSEDAGAELTVIVNCFTEDPDEVRQERYCEAWRQLAGAGERQLGQTAEQHIQ